MPSIQRDQRRLLVLIPLMAVLLAGCSTGEAVGWTFTPTKAPVATAAPSGSAAAPSGASSQPASGGETVAVSATGIKFDQSSLKATAGKAFTIDFKNNDAGIPHNVAIYKGTSASGTPLFSGDLVTGPASKQYSVPALQAGQYFFVCEVHPTVMTGTLTVQ